MFLTKCDKNIRIRSDWKKEVEKQQKFSTFNEFTQFMEGRCNAYSRAMN